MRIAVVMFCALTSASSYAQAQAPAPARGTAPPPPPATETVAPGIPGVVAAGTKVAIVKDGLRSSEGPIMMPDGTTLFTEPGASTVHKIDKNGAISTFVENTGRANGLALDSKGRLIATTALTIEVLHPPAAKTVLAKMSTRPNDLVVDKKDGVYFTLPSDKPSAVYYIPAGGQATKVGEAPGAHGIQLSPDEKTLYSADSGGEYLIAFDVQPDGKLTNKRNFGKYQGLPTPESHADGIAVDSQGRVYVGIATGVQVFSPKGDALGVIPTSQRPQNLAFAGPDKKTLYLTGGSAMFKVQMLAQGYLGRAK
jgi:gluconolactonase